MSALFPTKLIKRFICLFLLILFIGHINLSISQNKYSKTDLQVALLKSLPEHFEWPNENEMNAFKIALVTEDQEFITTFNAIASNKKIKNKAISVNTYNNMHSEMRNVQMIFIDDNFKESYLDIFDYVESLPVLIVSDEYTDKRFVMVNLFVEANKKMNFEINKANIVNQKISVGDEILLIGGNFIDVAELYRKSQASLRSIEKQLNENERIYDSLNNKILASNATISEQINLINTQRNKSLQIKQKLDSVEFEFEKQKHLIDSQRLVLVTQKQNLSNQQNKLEETTINLKKQESNINDAAFYLKKVEVKIDSLNNEIVNNQKVLNEQTIKITRQRQILVLFIIAIIIFVLLSSVIYYTLRSIKLKNRKLHRQKQNIEKINNDLKQSNKELNDKNEEINQTLEQLKTTQNQLLQSEKMASLGVLTAGIAHELNNPINFVYAGVNSITKDLEDIIPILNEIKQLKPDLKNTEEFIKCIYKMAQENYFNEAVDGIIETVNDIKIGAERSSEIIKGLRNFSRSEKNERNLSDIHQVINDVLILLKNKYKHSINIDTIFDSNLPEIECNSGKINQAFMNIINNAIDAIQDQGNITIKTKQNIDYIEVSIRDDGNGISEENVNKIFDPFFTTKEVGKGIGLGLSITFSIIKEHGGTIKVHSEINNGTEFLVQLPIKSN